MEQQKIRKTFSEQSVNVEMERGDIGFKKIKKLLEKPIHVKIGQFTIKKNEETPVHVDYFSITYFFW